MDQPPSIYGLNKSTLSYSAINLWETSHEQYRNRYYKLTPWVDTPETLYGKKIHKMIETEDPFVKKVPRYTLGEYQLKTVISDVPVIAYIDSLCQYTNRFLDFKTGRPRPDGSPRWTALEVAKTDQLPFYSLFLKEKFGHVTDLCHLIWLPTKTIKKSIEHLGNQLGVKDEIEWNGEVHVFPRVIHEYERKAAREKIIRIAKEISNDYETYTKTKNRIL